MALPIEEIVGKIGRERTLPGTRPGQSDEVRYVSFTQPAKPADLFEDVVWKISPPVVSNGGVSLANFVVTTPDGTSFYALEYHGDVPGWIQQIERGAVECNVASARIEADQFFVSDGRSFLLSQCKIEYVPSLASS